MKSFNLARRLVAEGAGTYMLVSTIVLASSTQSVLAPLAIGMVLMVMVFTFGYVSGAKFNPAVSFAIFLCRRMGALETVLEMLVQIAAGILAAAIANQVPLDFKTFSPHPNAEHLFRGAKNYHVGIASAYLEMLFTGVLTSVVLHNAVSKHTSKSDNQFFGFCIGMIVFVGAVCAGPYTGGSFNPAVTVGLSLANLWHRPTHLLTETILGWMGIVVPLQFVAAALAALFYYYIFEMEGEAEVEYEAIQA